MTQFSYYPRIACMHAFVCLSRPSIIGQFGTEDGATRTLMVMTDWTHSFHPTCVLAAPCWGIPVHTVRFWLLYMYVFMYEYYECLITMNYDESCIHTYVVSAGTVTYLRE